MEKPEVTVCMPVYNGAAFVAAALRSVRAQTFTKLRVLVSVDPSSDDSLDICRRFSADPRIEVHAQPERRGWVGNTNRLIERVDTDYFFVMPQDDLLRPTYVAVLLERLAREPAAVCAFGDLRVFASDGKRRRLFQPSITGNLERRLVAFLLGHLPAVAFRGLVARHRLAAPVLLRHNAAGDFAADTVWLLELARAGELHRVEGVHYAKRVHPESETQRWAARSERERLDGWLEHCVQCARIALDAAGDEPARAMVSLAAAARLRQWQPSFSQYIDFAALPEAQRDALESTFLRRSGITADPDALRAAARHSPLAAQLPPALDPPLQPPAHEQAAAFVALARNTAERALHNVQSGEAPPLAAAPPARAASPADPLISVVVCSIDADKRKRIRAEYERVLAGRRFELIQIPDAKSLAEAYNRGFARSKGEVIIFSHDDIELLSADFAGRLLAHLARCDLVGVAGGSRLCGPSWVRAYWPCIHGCVAHVAGNDTYTFDWYGPPRKAGIQVLDGLFLAATRRLCQAVPFDERTFDGFHLYDADFSYRAHLAGFRIGVACDLLLLHHSRGKFDEAFRLYGRRFTEKHRERLLVEIQKKPPDWSTLALKGRGLLLEYHRLMQEVVAASL